MIHSFKSQTFPPVLVGNNVVALGTTKYKPKVLLEKVLSK